MFHTCREVTASCVHRSSKAIEAVIQARISAAWLPQGCRNVGVWESPACTPRGAWSSCHPIPVSSSFILILAPRPPHSPLIRAWSCHPVLVSPSPTPTPAPRPPQHTQQRRMEQLGRGWFHKTISLQWTVGVGERVSSEEVSSLCQ